MLSLSSFMFTAWSETKNVSDLLLFCATKIQPTKIINHLIIYLFSGTMRSFGHDAWDSSNNYKKKLRCAKGGFVENQMSFLSSAYIFLQSSGPGREYIEINTAKNHHW